jgi:hypothetical protein
VIGGGCVETIGGRSHERGPASLVFHRRRRGARELLARCERAMLSHRLAPALTDGLPAFAGGEVAAAASRATCAGCASSTRAACWRPMRALPRSRSPRGSPDQVLVAHHTKNAAHDIPVGRHLRYAESFKCPVEIYYGLYDHFVVASRRMAEVARAEGLDVTAIAINGDHDSSVPESIAKSVTFFRSR